MYLNDTRREPQLRPTHKKMLVTKCETVINPIKSIAWTKWSENRTAQKYIQCLASISTKLWKHNLTQHHTYMNTETSEEKK